MAERGELRRGGETLLVDVLDLEQEVRQARAFAEEELRYGPWTGDTFRRLGDIPALAPAFDAADARFAAWVRAKRSPWLTLIAVLGVALAGALQQGVTAAWGVGPDGPRWVASVVLAGATGYEPLLLDGGWWTPWTAELLHAGGVHLAMNLPILAYCGFRVERALGPAATAVVAAAAVAGGTALVTLFGALPVIGASIVAYGLWGAQIAVGFRAGDAMPPGFRGFYGWGNLVLFVPLFVSGLGVEGVSHLGHVGGLLGGVVAAALVPAETFAPRARVRGVQGLAWAMAAALAVAPSLVGLAMARMPAALAWPGETVEAPETGVRLRLPWRMAARQGWMGGMPAWVVSPNGRAPVWVGMARLADRETPLPELLADSLEHAFAETPEPIEAPPSPVPGWDAYAWRLRGADGAERGRVVEVVRVRGETVWRAGYRVDANADPSRGREALYRWILGTLEAADPPALVEARRKHTKYPDEPKLAYEAAVELVRVGETAEADAVLAALTTRSDGWAWDAARLRLRAWALDAAWPGDADWVLAWLARAPANDTGIHGPGLRWLAEHGRCDAAMEHLGALRAAGADDRTMVAVADALEPCSGAAEGP